MAATVNTINEAIKAGKQIMICPWDVWTNQAQVRVTMVAAGRTVEYGWESLDGDWVTKSKVVTFSTWNEICQQAAR